MASFDLPTSMIEHDFLSWHKTLRELRDHNARLAQIISELLIKNQQLRTAGGQSTPRTDLGLSESSSKEAA